ncbi:uncharacterized protein DUF547 [Lutibacter sp. Hel_I_33_5]|uniref:DUF547 domain-containing protein n=1 Tax=Lutibacter sp. Hel_I_33_5 TaxID=1566289 RepID=UPI0011AA4A0A|nr:DUF547 domain-containing protein [Lutibacter sp. Hel_I_33_5]TVZ56836.1 uncharacterized protein DUF547 [Lutibacter sp. Hel_I_33_5]
MKKSIAIIFILMLTFNINAQTEKFDSLLKTHVDKDGNVDYKGFKKDEAKLDAYLTCLVETKIDKSWSAAKTKAFWANAYNAYTVKLILKNYPLKSIMKVKKKGKDAWNIPFANVGGKTYTLNNIEHDVLRKNYKDPKIHVAVNCASGSCPQLGNFAFTEENYEAKTEELMKKFINDPKRNKVSEKKAQLSKIFDWYKKDFTTNGSLKEYLNKYSDVITTKKTKVSYLKYDWSLNGK